MGLRHFLHAHPIAGAAISIGTIVAVNNAQWTRSVARVRCYKQIQESHTLVEMDDDNIFVASPELLPSLYACRQSQTPVNYWICKTKRFYDQPRGGLGNPPKAWI